MESKEDNDSYEEQPSSPLWVLQHISEEAVRVANDYLGSGNSSPVWAGHKRSQSEITDQTHRHTSSFQSLKSQISKAWRWGGNSQYENRRFNFNPEVLANQKRQWYQLHNLDRSKYQDPTALFDHFIVMGLLPDTNLKAVEASFARRKKRELENNKFHAIDERSACDDGPCTPSLDPQIIFKYPPGKRLPMRPKDLCAFSFPGGVKARVLERTPSLSDLNSLVYGQEHQGRDDLAFVFSVKAGEHGTIYGVCVQVPEMVQRLPSITGSSSPLSHSSAGCSRFLVSAPRCYCLLTRVPFFELHYEMLNSIIAQERLNRITQFVNEMTLGDFSHPITSGQIDSPTSEGAPNWISAAIPVDNAIALAASSAGILPDDEVPSTSSKSLETQSPSSVDASEASDYGSVKESDHDGNVGIEDNDNDVSETHGNGFGTPYESYENDMSSLGPTSFPHSDNRKLERSNSSQSLYSSVRSMDGDDDNLSNHDSDFSGDFMTMEWAKENKNDLLQIVCAYGASDVPTRGSEILFQPLEHLQAILYKRPSVADLGVDESLLDTVLHDPTSFAETNARLASAEEAVALSVWTTATVCRVLSLDSVLALLTGVLLEKQVVIICPNLGILSATVLSIIPMIRPFEWQSLFLPILPKKMLDFLDAPVPYIVGIHNKPAGLKIKTSNLINVNVAKDQVKMCSLPYLPRRKELYSELRPLHAAMAGESQVAEKHPVYRCNEVQAEAATQFLEVMRRYLESLCADLRSYTITSVQSNDRVSLLLKDSFIDSFSSRDRPFIKLFVDTQMFSVLSDSRLTTFELEKS